MLISTLSLTKSIQELAIKGLNKEDQYFLDHIILYSRNDEVHNINEAILQQFNLGPNTEVHMLRSIDSVSKEDGMYHTYSAEFL